MNKRKKRQPFGSTPTRSTSDYDETISADDQAGGAFGFFRDFGVRETIESIIVAIVLAMMFRAFEAEAFIIPTGSMAPSLQGQHMDLECEQCRYRYRAGASMNRTVDQTFCPICQYETKMSRKVADHHSNNGDRILVNKFVYDSKDPERYDVIVFKNPNNGKQNYIKRLVGMPGDNLLVENGDIHVMDKSDDGSWTKRITRKPPEKLTAVLQIVDDTDFIGPKLEAINWPSRWNTWSADTSVDRQISNGKPNFRLSAQDEETVMRYRHLRPLKSEWSTIENGELPRRMQPENLPAGRLITDYYAYNDWPYQDRRLEYSEGLHWVGDIGLEADVKIETSSGVLILDLVEGGAQFRCEIDVANGQATLECDDPDVKFVDGGGDVQQPLASTTIRGKGEYVVRYVNADDRINLWIDGELVEFNTAEFVRDEIAIPAWSPTEPGDAEPLGIGCRNTELTIKRMKVLRDIYYTSVKDGINSMNLGNETGFRNIARIEQLHQQPQRWSDPTNIQFFNSEKNHTEPMFVLKDFDDPALDQFLPMGDNSPSSLDGRVWDGPKFLNREMLIGRAAFIYWPHSKNSPIKYFPNFERMKFIR